MQLRPLVLILGLTGFGLAACSSTPSAGSATPAAKPATMAAPAAATVANPVMPAKPADATVLPDGLAYKILRPGTGTVHPKLTDSVTANYTVWKGDGEFLESSCTAGKCDPATFPLDKLIPGWQEMIPMMTVGEKVQLWLTADLAYGDPPRKPNRPAGPLTFEIEMIDIGRPLPPPTPETQK
ncbi:MAG TPA: FKBP-type peptidyl-prolyl cis-trans isomerase [Gammaproteobacteria bacterium]|jgi:FKBP-type peptidyl-prolyl cis-trans isomerase